MAWTPVLGHCNLCGDRVTRANLGYEGRSKAFNGSMRRGTGRAIYVCADCNSAGEYQQFLAREREAAKWERKS